MSFGTQLVTVLLPPPCSTPDIWTFVWIIRQRMLRFRSQLPALPHQSRVSDLNNTPSLPSDIWHDRHGNVDTLCAMFNMLISEICQGFLGTVKAKMKPKKKDLGFSAPSSVGGRACLLSGLWLVPTRQSASPKTDWAFSFPGQGVCFVF